jgi:hypothetical protein
MARSHGMKLQNPEFADVRNAGGKREITNKYNEIRTVPKYSSLPAVRSAEQAEEELRKWEAANAEATSRMRDDVSWDVA